MFKDVQDIVAVFVHLALASTFSLNLAILTAGLVNARMPVGCKACAQGVAAHSTAKPGVKTVAMLLPRTH